MEKTVQDYYDKIGENMDKIYCRLIRPGQQEAYDVPGPGESFLDLTIVYDLRLELAGGERISMRITDTLLKKWQMDAAALRRLAWENTYRDCRELFCPMQQIFEECGVNVHTPDNRLYVLTNQDKYFGAVCLAYPGVPEGISRQLGGDYYVLPSSVHECLMVRCEEELSAASLRKMVAYINDTELQPSEILSYSVYRNVKSENRLMIDNS